MATILTIADGLAAYLNDNAAKFSQPFVPAERAYLFQIDPEELTSVENEKVRITVVPIAEEHVLFDRSQDQVMCTIDVGASAVAKELAGRDAIATLAQDLARHFRRRVLALGDEKFTVHEVTRPAVYDAELLRQHSVMLSVVRLRIAYYETVVE